MRIDGTRRGKCKAMHGRGGGEERKKARHMWTVPIRATAVLSGDGGASPSSSSSIVNSFSKV